MSTAFHCFDPLLSEADKPGSLRSHKLRGAGLWHKLQTSVQSGEKKLLKLPPPPLPGAEEALRRTLILLSGCFHGRIRRWTCEF